MFARGSERLPSHFISPEWGTAPPRRSRAGDLPPPFTCKRTPKPGLLDLISCCAFCKIRIRPSPSPEREQGCEGVGWGVGSPRRRAVRVEVKLPPALRHQAVLRARPCHRVKGLRLLSPQTSQPWACLRSWARELQVGAGHPRSLERERPRRWPRPFDPELGASSLAEIEAPSPRSPWRLIPHLVGGRGRGRRREERRKGGTRWGVRFPVKVPGVLPSRDRSHLGARERPEPQRRPGAGRRG